MVQQHVRSAEAKGPAHPVGFPEESVCKSAKPYPQTFGARDHPIVEGGRPGDMLI